jgi:oligopeptide transport system substrate-binding protein
VFIPLDVLRRRLAPLIVAVALFLSGCSQASFGQAGADVNIAGGAPFTWDPARAGDTTSANAIAQVFEGLTTFDINSKVQPALADSWQATDDGRQITFHLRPGITFSDGSPVTAQDVVDSWLRLVDPAQPSPLASLVADVAGVSDYLAGKTDADGVGLDADGENVVVQLRRPATYFLAVTGSPSLAVYPRSEFGRDPALPLTVSGAYVPTGNDGGSITLRGNPNYWAGLPPLDVIELVSDFGGKNPTDAFQDGTVDFTGISGADAPWLQYDRELGSQLRHDSDFTVSYYAFNTTADPFDDADVRLAFAKAVDWDRIASLGGGIAATSMVPIGVPGRDDEDHRPAFDPDAARDLLEQAGFPGGAGLPPITIATYGVGGEQTVATELEANLGVQVAVEVISFRDYETRLRGPDAPDITAHAWSADYPHPHDFLGLLLETGSSSNSGNWSNAAYDALLEDAAATADADEQARIYAQAQDILATEAPVVPFAYLDSWALSRDGLLGADSSGVGIIRFAGLDWAPGAQH